MRSNRCSLVLVFAASLAVACSPTPTPTPDAARDVIENDALADSGVDASDDVSVDSAPDSLADAPSDTPADSRPDAGADAGSDAAPDVEIVRGCAVLRAPQGMAGEPAMGDTFADFVGPLLTRVCTRCHSSTLGSGTRSGAPMGLDWDQETSVRMNLPLIRNAVGVLNYMPFNPPPDLTCEERRRIVRWIDIGAP